MPFALHAAYWRNRFGEPQRGARQRRLRSSPLESTHDHAMHPRSGRRIAVIDTTDREGSFVGRPNASKTRPNLGTGRGERAAFVAARRGQQ